MTSAAVRSTVERIEVWADGERIGTTFANPVGTPQFVKPGCQWCWSWGSAHGRSSFSMTSTHHPE